MHPYRSPNPQRPSMSPTRPLVSVADLVVRFEEGPRLPAAQFTLHSLGLRCKREQSLPRLLSFCFRRRAPEQTDEHSCKWSVEAIAGVTWHPAGTAGLSVESGPTTVGSTAAPSIDVLQRVSLRAELAMRIQWAPRDSGGSGGDGGDGGGGSRVGGSGGSKGSDGAAAPRLRLEGSAEVGSVRADVTDAHLEWSVRMAVTATCDSNSGRHTTRARRVLHTRDGS
eukprot:4114168-Prymnesium_polylepis.1